MLILMSDIQFIVGDSVEKMRELVDKDIRYHSVVTSPPYNIGIEYDGYDDNLSEEAYNQFTVDWAKAALDITHDDGFLFLNIGERRSNWYFTHDIAKLVELAGWFPKVKIYWLRTNPRYHSQGGDLTNTMEYIFCFTKTDKTKFPDRYAIGTTHVENMEKFLSRKYKKREKRNGHFIRDRGNFWMFREADMSKPYQVINIFESKVVMKNQSTDQSWEQHGARFPLVLPAACIAISTKLDDWVLDPFNGTGTTALASERLGRNFTGIDQSQNYINAARDRITQSEEQLPSFYPKPKTSKRGRALF